MLVSQIPQKFPIVFAASAGVGFINTIPSIPQSGSLASLPTGFPPLSFQPVATGGSPLWGADMNGILNQISAWSQWQNMGGPVSYDGSFSTAIGGYAKNSWLLTATGNGWWISLVDNNTSDPDTGGANWQFLAFGQTYAGNPNGNVAGVAGSAYGLTQALLWDTSNKILWLCTTTGTASTAIWTQLTGASSGPVWCGTSGGTANAQILTPPASLQSFIAGTSITFKAGPTNTGSLTITLGSFGSFAAKKQGPTGSLSLSGGEVVAGDIITGVYDGTNIQLTTIAMGSAAQANASSNTGVVAAVSGSVSIGHIAIFSDTIGTVVDGGSPGVAIPTYLNASNNGNTLGSGIFIVDTNYSGAFSVNLPASPALGAILDLTDIAGTWATANFTLNNNGNTIMGSTSPLICNRSGEDFKIWWNGSDWRLA